MMNTLDMNALYLAIALIVGFCFCWAVGSFTLSKKQYDDALKALIDNGNLLRIVAATFIVIATSFLVLVDKLPGDAGAAILSGVAGFVLGGFSRPGPKN